MKISKKTDYALRALFTLVEHEGRGPIPIRELASRNDAPKRFMEHIMLDLKSQGWVGSIPGKSGGYILARKASKIMMGQIVRHFDGLMAPIGCVSVSQHEQCSQAPACRFRRLFLEIRNDYTRRMDQMSLASVFAGRPVRREEVFDMQLISGAGI